MSVGQLRQVEMPKLVAFLLIATTTGILALGLWPFGYPIPNQVETVSDPPGIRFFGEKGRAKLDAGGIAYTAKALSVPLSTHTVPGAITLAFKVKASLMFTRAVGTIVAFCDHKNALKMVFGQWKSHLIIRTFYFPTDKRGPYTEIGVRDVLTPGKTGLITVTADSKSTMIYFDGHLARKVVNVRLLPQDVGLSGFRIYLGNSPSVTTAWDGDIYGFELYGRALTADEVLENYRSWAEKPVTSSNLIDGAVVKYNFVSPEDRKVPNILMEENALIFPEQVDIKQPPLERALGYEADVEDVVVNIVGFIPFGFLGVLWLRKRYAGSILAILVVVVLGGFALSLGIELAQSYMPTRNSSLLDLITNLTGTVIGAVAAYLCLILKKLPDAVPKAYGGCS